MAATTDELRADIERRRDRMSGTMEEIGDHVRPRRILDRRTRAARSWAGGVRARVMGSAEDAGGTVSTKLSEGASEMGDRVQHAGQQIADAPTTLARQTQGAPLVAGAIAFGVGALVALVIPETEPEHRAMDAVQPQLDSATDAVKEVGRNTAESMKGTVQQAADDLKQEATSRAGELGEDAKEAGESVAREARRPNG
jgi:hypothetical protein